MKLLRVLELLKTVLRLQLLLKFVSFCKVTEALATNKDTIMTKGNGHDFLNTSVLHEVGFSNGIIRSRAKRFIAFPIGSSFSTAVCMTTGVIGNPHQDYLSMGLNWGIAYDLPNSTWVLQNAKGFGTNDQDQEEYVSPQIKRRHRRDLYGKLETLMNGYLCTMQHTIKHNVVTLNSSYFLRSNTSQSFWIIKAFVILMIYSDMLSIKKNVTKSAVTFAEQASVGSESTTPTPTLVQFITKTSRDILAINNFDGNFTFSKNQIMAATQRQKMFTDNNDLLLAMENCKKPNSCCCQTCTSGNNTTNCCGSTAAIATATEATLKLITAMTTADMTTEITTTKLLTLNKSSTLSSSMPLSSSSSTLSPTKTAKSLSLSRILWQQKRLLSRPKRYLSFPEGSSFSVAVCFTVGIIGNPRYNYMSFGLNWGVAYDLPNTTWILNHLHGFAKRPIPLAAWHRRSKRTLYTEIENVVDNMGYNGRDCVLRALCESRQYFQKTKMGMIGEMLRLIFSLPKQRIYTRELAENEDIELYDHAYRRARSVEDCSQAYDCGFSLLELAFGKYSAPPAGYYQQH